MEQRAGSGALRRALALAAAGLVGLACLLLMLVRLERRAVVGARASDGGAPEVAHEREAPQLLAPAALEGSGLTPAPAPAAATAARAQALDDVLPRQTVDRMRPEIPHCVLKIRVTCGDKPADGMALHLQVREGEVWKGDLPLGRSDQNGLLAIAVDPAKRARVVARSSLDRAELGASHELELVAGSIRRIELAANAGRLLLVLPGVAFNRTFATHYRVIPQHDSAPWDVTGFFDAGAWQPEGRGFRTDVGWVKPAGYVFRVQIETHLFEVNAHVAGGPEPARFALKETGD